MGETCRWALVTGASSGIGYELAKCLAQDGYGLILAARSEAKLGEVRETLCSSFGVPVRTMAMDLSRAEAPQEIFRTLSESGLPIEILVNNAGYGTHGPFTGTHLEDEMAMIQVNVTALTHLTKLFLKGMVERKSGRILNVASTAAFQPGPLMAVYYATKAYVLLFTEALAQELEGTGVTVTALCPGPTLTGFQARAGIENIHIIRAGMLMDAESVARAGYQGLIKGKTLVIPGILNKVFAFLVRFVPRRWVTRLVRTLQEEDRGSALDPSADERAQAQRASGK